MRFLEGIRLALHQIRTEKLKSFFSMLGVIVGVMFLIVVVRVVEGMDRYVREDLSSVAFGVNTVTLRRFTDGPTFNGSSSRRRARRPRIRYEDWEIIEDRLTIPALVGVESATGGEVIADNGKRVENVRINGVSAEMFQIKDWDIVNGRPFSPQEDDRGAAVVVLGKDPADLLFENLDPIGRRVRIRGFSYRVIGVLEEQGSIFGQSLDNLVIAPSKSPIQAVTNPHGIVDQVVIKALDPDMVRPIKSEVEGILRTARRLRPSDENNFSLETADETLAFWDTISRILFTALPALVATSLVVGGIVISMYLPIFDLINQLG